jgi:hypothetical protein
MRHFEFTNEEMLDFLLRYHFATLQHMIEALEGGSALVDEETLACLGDKLQEFTKKVVYIETGVAENDGTVFSALFWDSFREIDFDKLASSVYRVVRPSSP